MRAERLEAGGLESLAVEAGGTRLEIVFVAFGGIEVKVPDGWHVVIRGFPIFGGFENKTARDKLPAEAPTLVVNATVLFGGLEVKH